MIFWQHILTKLKAIQKVYLLTVIENFGSSPGRKGFKMMVSEDGFIFGSIGGGIMEFTLVEEAKTLMQNNAAKIFIKKQIHKGNKQDGSGMICSGEQTVAFHPLDKKDIATIENILDGLNKNQNGIVQLSPTAFHFNLVQMNNQFKVEIKTQQDWNYKENIGFKNTLYIVGGGHVSLAVSELFVSLGFYVVVFDNRAALNTFELNTFAHQKMVVNYEDISNHLKNATNSFIAIMTNKYFDDKLVLSKLLGKKIKYIGVLGSKAKLKTMWKDLKKEGFKAEDLNKVYAPIGVSIKSETPKEIAVSIAAEIIGLRVV